MGKSVSGELLSSSRGVDPDFSRKTAVGGQDKTGRVYRDAGSAAEFETAATSACDRGAGALSQDCGDDALMDALGD